MQVIDADTHLTPTGEGILIDQLISMMEKAGVEKSITYLQPPYMRLIDDLNAYVYKATREHPGKILGFGWVDPHLGLSHAKETVKRCVEEFGFYGVKLNGAQNAFYLDDEKLALPIVEEIAKTGRILALHVGSDFYQFTHPYLVGKMADLYPELRILMIHMGGVAIPNLSRAAVDIARSHPNIMLIASAISPKDALQAIVELGSDRVCFGSDTPFEFMHVELAKYEALLSGDSRLTETDKANFFHDNIHKFLRL